MFVLDLHNLIRAFEAVGYIHRRLLTDVYCTCVYITFSAYSTVLTFGVYSYQGQIC